MEREFAERFFEDLFERRLSERTIKEVLEEMYQRGESLDEIVAASTKMKKYMIKISPSVKENLLDIVGTGGDGSGSLNISTISSFVAAGAGCYVAKHCNKGASSKVGSADLLIALGIKIDLRPKKTRKLIEETGIGFMYAPIYHPAMKYVAKVRKEIKHRTIFNILGPLTNPANAQDRLIGAYNEETAEKLAEASKLLGLKRAIVVYGESGIDEASVSSKTKVISLGERNDGELICYTIDPCDYGFERCQLEDLRVSSARESAEACLKILSGKSLEGKLRHMREAIIFNSGLAIYTNNKCPTLSDGIELAKKSIEEGAAMNKLNQLRSLPI